MSYLSLSCPGRLFLLGAALYLHCGPVGAAEPLAEQLRKLPTTVLQDELHEQADRMLYDQQRARVQQANDASSKAWAGIDSTAAWEAFRDQRLEAMRRSFGPFPQPPASLPVHITASLPGEGYVVDKLVFQSRPGLWVSALLYRPARIDRPAPGIIVSHAHHTPKSHGELQDMGATWARAGCYVLTPDHLGHGERREHPFQTEADYPGEFRVSRQDYYHRYDSGIQLHLAGSSLIGWLQWDLQRGVDLLLQQPNIDPQAIILMGAVAGGGDPAAVTAALDKRITCAAPFNFGGPQPEAGFPLPENVEKTFNYAGGGSWESTRNISDSARDGFLHWVIVGGIAPRRLIYGYEFGWDQEHDPVWKRFVPLYGMYKADDKLGYSHGFGSIRIREKPASHCTHIGPVHRVRIHQHLKEWFGVPISPEQEYSARRESSELLCWTPELRKKLAPQSLTQLLPSLVEEQLKAARTKRASLQDDAFRTALRRDLDAVLGQTAPLQPVKVVSSQALDSPLAGAPEIEATQIVLQTENGIVVPLLLLSPPKSPRRCVLAFCQEGKEQLLRARAAEFAKLLQAGVAICLPDLRGTGETDSGSDRDQTGSATAVSSTGLMLGDPLPAQQLRDLRSVARFLQTRSGGDALRLSLWGDSLAKTNSADANLDVPRRIDGRPRQSEPLGGLLALLGGLYLDDIDALYVHGGLASFADVLTRYQVLIPHDVVIPGLLTQADVVDLAAAQTSSSLLLQELVNGNNQPLDQEAVQTAFAPVAKRYAAAGNGALLKIDNNASPAAWLLQTK
ncbi:dienelactone hydrolase family protein [Lignipirellula cremea]|uniref:Lysophospholipase n=1 Tax=Lignipirellula cremea TaxID=2528010 RepID=A0A518DYM4_9BACT|nr:hypothetical protein [Lignipirellula cremea]QDU96948.1 Putative lysophospholipase [Lignipirellula cremea]